MTDENPYRSPLVAELQNPSKQSAEARRTCPRCLSHTFPFWRLYWLHPLRRVRCPRCEARLRLAKFGFGRWSSALISVPCGIVGAYTVLNWLPLHLPVGKFLQITELFTLPVFVGVFLATIAADYLIDKQYVCLQCLDAEMDERDHKIKELTGP